MRTLMFISAFVLLGFYNPSLDPYAELQKIMDVVNTPKDFIEYSIDISYYDSINSDEIAEKLSLSVATQGHSSYLKTDGIEIVQIDELSIYVDHDEKIIRIMDIQKSPSGPLEDVLNFVEYARQIDELKVSLVELKGSLAKISFTAPDFSDSSIDMIYDRSNHFLVSTNMIVSLSDGMDNDFNNKRVFSLYKDFKRTKKSFPYKKSDFVRWNGKKYVPVMKKHKGFSVLELNK